jgi:hypothetical protein
MTLLANFSDALTLIGDDRDFIFYFERCLFNKSITMRIGSTSKNTEGVIYIENTSLTFHDIEQDPLHCIKEFLFRGNKKRYSKISYINEYLTAYLINDKIYINDTEII